MCQTQQLIKETAWQKTSPLSLLKLLKLHHGAFYRINSKEPSAPVGSRVPETGEIFDVTESRLW